MDTEKYQGIEPKEKSKKHKIYSKFGRTSNAVIVFAGKFRSGSPGFDTSGMHFHCALFTEKSMGLKTYNKIEQSLKSLLYGDNTNMYDGTDCYPCYSLSQCYQLRTPTIYLYGSCLLAVHEVNSGIYCNLNHTVGEKTHQTGSLPSIFEIAIEQMQPRASNSELFNNDGFELDAKCTFCKPQEADKDMHAFLSKYCYSASLIDPKKWNLTPVKNEIEFNFLVSRLAQTNEFIFWKATSCMRYRYHLLLANLHSCKHPNPQLFMDHLMLTLTTELFKDERAYSVLHMIGVYIRKVYLTSLTNTNRISLIMKAPFAGGKTYIAKMLANALMTYSEKLEFEPGNRLNRDEGIASTLLNILDEVFTNLRPATGKPDSAENKDILAKSLIYNYTLVDKNPAILFTKTKSGPRFVMILMISVNAPTSLPSMTDFGYVTGTPYESLEQIYKEKRGQWYRRYAFAQFTDTFQEWSREFLHGQVPYQVKVRAQKRGEEVREPRDWYSTYLRSVEASLSSEED